MRSYVFLIRLSVLTALVLASLSGGGWKWGSIGH
jgi:hypothetical protein